MTLKYQGAKNRTVKALFGLVEVGEYPSYEVARIKAPVTLAEMMQGQHGELCRDLTNIEFENQINEFKDNISALKKQIDEYKKAINQVKIEWFTAKYNLNLGDVFVKFKSERVITGFGVDKSGCVYFEYKLIDKDGLHDAIRGVQGFDYYFRGMERVGTYCFDTGIIGNKYELRHYSEL